MLKTWDIFDTLIARRCIFPYVIFQNVEHISNVGNFAQVRMEAERRLSNLNVGYNLDDIYDEFQRMTGVAKNLCDNLKKLECDVELNQCIPITENINQVKAGDILISDMYLPEKFIRQMLSKAGLLVHVEIVITNNGKSSGRIWKQLADQKEFVFHIGDNPDADIKNPRLVGLESSLSILSNPTPIEQYLLQKDFNFGAYLREIRLRNPFSEEIKRLYWQLFTVNIGVLILLVQYIDEIQKKHDFEYLGFCGRDTYYLRLLYEKYKIERGEEPVPNDYLYYSRRLARYSGAELAEYFADKINGRKALMLDLYGTGTNIHNLRENFNLNFAILICFIADQNFRRRTYPNMLHIENWTSAFETKMNMTDKQESIFILEDDGKAIKVNDKIEPLNRALHNSPVRLKNIRIGEKLLPEVVFSEDNDTENFDVLETCLKEVLKSKLILPINISGGGINEILPSLLNAINDSYVSLPLKGKHDVVSRSFK